MQLQQTCFQDRWKTFLWLQLSSWLAWLQIYLCTKSTPNLMNRPINLIQFEAVQIILWSVAGLRTIHRKGRFVDFTKTSPRAWTSNGAGEKRLSYWDHFKWKVCLLWWELCQLVKCKSSHPAQRIGFGQIKFYIGWSFWKVSTPSGDASSLCVGEDCWKTFNRNRKSKNSLLNKTNESSHFGLL